MRRWIAIALLLAAPLRAQEPEKKPEPPLDPVTGMKVAEHWELVRMHCTVCHSPQQYLRQKGTAATWSDTIDWMQKSGGLWPLDPETREKIVAYLAENYGPDAVFRRAPIPGHLLPANPYATGTREEFEERKKAGLIPGQPGVP